MKRRPAGRHFRICECSVMRVAVRLAVFFGNVRFVHGYGGRLLAAGDLLAAAAFQFTFLEFVHDLFDLLFLAVCFLRHDYAPLKPARAN